MSDATYQPKVYRKQGGDELVVANGGTLTVESGGVLDNNGAPASVAFTIDSTASNTKTITIQVYDATGTAYDGIVSAQIELYADSAGAAFVSPTSAMTLSTGPDATATDLVVQSTAHPEVGVYARSSTAGEINLKWTDTGATATYMGVVLGNGTVGISSAAITTT